MITKRYLLTFILFTFWIFSCRQVKKNNGPRVPGDMKSAIAFLNDTSTARLSIWKDSTGMGIKVFGKYWFNNVNGKAPVTIMLDQNKTDSTDIKYNNDGSFLADLHRMYLIKNYTLKVTQQNERGERKEASIDFSITSSGKD